MCVLPIMSSDIYFPVLPEIADYFDSTPLRVKNSLTLFLFGFAIGQLFYGVLSDLFGRKKLLTLGLVIYFISTLACALAPTIDFLNYARFLQGFAGCSGAIIGRVIIADYFDVKESAYIYTIIGPFIGASPVIAPIIGAVISTYWHWRYVFVFLAFVGLISLSLILLLLQESNNKQSKTTLSVYFLDCMKLFHNKKYLYYSSFVCGAYIAWFSFIVESSFLFSSHNFSLLQRSFLYIPLALPYILGNYLAKSLLKQSNIDNTMGKGLLLYTAGSIIFLFYAMISSKLVLIMIGMFLIVMSNGFLIPLGTAGAIGNITVNKGAGTALLGFIQLALSSFATFIVSYFEQSETQIQLALLIMVCGIVMWVCLRKLSVICAYPVSTDTVQYNEPKPSARIEKESL